MSYNSQAGSFNVGDLVYYTGYELVDEHESNHVGIVIHAGPESRAFRMYKVFWIHSGTTATVGGTHLELVYMRKN